MITMKHKLAYFEAKALRSHFIEILMILTKCVFDLGVRLTEFSVTVESITLRFYCTSHKNNVCCSCISQMYSIFLG